MSDAIREDREMVYIIREPDSCWNCPLCLDINDTKFCLPLISFGKEKEIDHGAYDDSVHANCPLQDLKDINQAYLLKNTWWF